MYFWNIDRLKAELHDAPLPAPDALAYVLAFLALWIVGSTLPGADRPMPEIPYLFPLRWALFAINAIGLCLAYRANGGRRGPDLAGRLLSLMWVTTVRLFVLVGVLGLVVLLVYIARQSRSISNPLESPNALLRMVVFFTFVPQLLLYWRLVHHIGALGEGRPLSPRVA